MEKDLDKKLYNDYLEGNKEAFEFLYSKYKKRIEYFIFNIVKDCNIAEDITQETFIYVMQNRIKENISFKLLFISTTTNKNSVITIVLMNVANNELSLLIPLFANTEVSPENKAAAKA